MKEADIFEMLSQCPWWVSVAFTAVVYAILKSTVPSIAGVAILFLLPAVFSLFNDHRKRELLNRQSGIDSIRRLSWREFEELLGEAYRRQGYRVVENAAAGPDGGVDLKLTRDFRTYLVQCKHWKGYKVGVKIVREMFGVMHHRNADGVIIVTSGKFTEEAQSFAANKPIQLVDGTSLVSLIQSVRGDGVVLATAAPPTLKPPSLTPQATPNSDPQLLCPRCGNLLVIRTAKRGKNSGSQFWGCSSFPKCRHIKPLVE